MHILEHLRPAVPKNWLFFLSGLMWTAVGIMLCSFAANWLIPLPHWTAITLGITGILLAGAIGRLGFGRLAIRNIERIAQIAGEKICLFAFQAWTSYPLVLFMIALGILLRKYSSLPKPMLAEIYFGIGGGLLLASLRYYRYLLTTE